MALWRKKVEPDHSAEVAATLDEADTIVRLTEYMFRGSDQPSIARGDYSNETAMRRLIAEHPEWPLAEKALFHLDTAAEMRKEAMERHGG